MKTIFLDLGKQPLANNLLTNENDPEFFFNLQVQFDTKTHLVSLTEFVKPELMFNSDYPYYSSTSYTMRKHFEDIATKIKSGKFNCYNHMSSKVLEIGSNDGVFISHFSPTSVCVEPCANFAEITRNKGYVTYDNFWDLNLAKIILKYFGTMDVIYSANCMCHIQNIVEAFQAIYELLDDNGVFIFEDPSLLDVIQNSAFDQFYDEHTYVFSIIALNQLLSEVGLYIDDVEHLPTHGGSNRVIVKKLKRDRYSSINVKKALDLEYGYKLNELYTYKVFGGIVEHNKVLLKGIYDCIKSHEKGFSGYGATSKSTVIYNYCGIKPDFVTDTTPFKQGKLIPGVHSPILNRQHKDFVFLGAWNYKDEILTKERNRDYKFITHIPKVAII